MKINITYKLALYAFLCMSLSSVYAQQTVIMPNGSIGIRNTSPIGSLDISSDMSLNYSIRSMFNTDSIAGTAFGLYNYMNGDPGSKIGIYNYLNGSVGGSDFGVRSNVYKSGGTAYGNYSFTNVSGSGANFAGYFYAYKPGSSSGDSYGLYSIANNYGTGNAYGIYATAGGTGTGTKYAGYFAGDIYVTGTITGSDRKLKRNIRTLSKNPVIDKVMQLKPSSYEYRDDLRINLSGGLQYGFVAQELEEVFPEMVREVSQPIFEEVEEDDGSITNKESGSVKFKAINYTSLIPVLTKAIQEQQAVLEAQQEELESLKALVSGNNKTIDDASAVLPDTKSALGQNYPNPASLSTAINYTLGPVADKASIAIYNLQGDEVLKFEDLMKGKSSVEISPGQLNPGIYFYTLLIDGQSLDIKKMIITR